MARKTTIKAFDGWISVEENLAAVLDRISGGVTLQKVSTQLKQPYVCLHDYFHGTPERLELYLKARKAWADAKQDEAIKIVDEVAEDRDAVAKAKLQVETYHNQAKAYHRERWGDRVQVEKSVSVTADAALIGVAGDLLRLVRKPRAGVVLEQAGETTAPEALLPARAVGSGQK